MTLTQGKAEDRLMKVVIVGAGVAGLATAYGLSRAEHRDRFDVRIIEKRTCEQCLEAGYPIHMSPSGREAIKSLLTPEDQHRLGLAAKTVGARHDGISFFNSDCKRIWHTLREPFESSLVERGDVLELLRAQVEGIEYDRKVVSVKDLGEEVAVMLSSGETIHADIVIGSDGMFSAVRKALHPVDDFHPMPWVTCNFRLSPHFYCQDLGADPLGINVYYGTGWSAAVMPLADGGAYVALTVPAPIHSIASALALLPDSPLLEAIRNDKEVVNGRAFPLYSATTTQVGRGRLVLIGDAAHGMNPFCGAGASMALNDADNIVKVLTGTEGLDTALPTFHKITKKTADPMIRMSKILLWLAQGKTARDRFVRGLAFRTIELVEKVLPTRRRMQRRLDKVMKQEAGERRTSRASSTSTLVDIGEKGVV